MIGLFLSLLIGLLSLWISSIHPSFDSLVLSIIMGMLIGNFFEKKYFLEYGLSICIRYFIPVAIILYGTQLTFSKEYISNFISISVIFVITFSLTFLISRILKINKPFSLLLASGLSVCGASAIAVISPLIGAKKEETSISIISIMVVGLLGLIIYPLFSTNSGLSKEGFAFFTGATLPMIGQVKVVGSIIGDEILSKALNYKLLRISLLMLLIIWLGIISKDKREEGFISFPPIFRIILVSGFLAMVILVNTMAPALQGFFEPWSRFFLTVALAAIGLGVDFDSVADIGPKPLYAVFISWLVVDLLVYFYCIYYV